MRQRPKGDFGDRAAQPAPCPPGSSWNGTQCVGIQANQATLLPPADAAVLANVQIIRTPAGTWRCMGRTGVCTPPEVQSLARTVTTTVKSVSNIKSLLVVAPDGTITCRDSVDGRPCTPAETDGFASSLKARHETLKNAAGNMR
ncbi:hypothetical protein [Paludibaculum fermentans]|uniref:hypothetical protein n=1 Tax=Paludibaculum fermentans TaxID=1473598 RepID=UPI003EB90B17